MSTVINLFAGPGAGKSSVAAGIFYELKKQNKSIELVQEHAKDLVYNESYKELRDQFLIAAQQHHRVWRLNSLVDYIVTDSPLLLSAAYTDDIQLRNLTNAYSKKYNNLNIFLIRDNTFNPNGRLQNLEESIKLDKKVLQVLDDYSTRYIKVKVNESTVQKIIELIEML